MSFAYLVVYEGRPREPEEWLRYYREVHVPLVWRFPGLRGVELHVGEGDGDFFLVTRLLFDTLEELRSAITGEHRTVTRRDMDENILPRFDGRVRHQVTRVLQADPP